MKNKKSYIVSILIALLAMIGVFFQQGDVLKKLDTTKENVVTYAPQVTETIGVTEDSSVATTEDANKNTIKENETCDDKDGVVLYLTLYHHLPDNYITKAEAKSYGWTGGGLDPYKEGACIGGDYFGNYEKKLPAEKGKKYYECDLDTMHQSKRGAKRLVFSNDGDIFYTEDHYTSFTKVSHVDANLSGEE